MKIKPPIFPEVTTIIIGSLNPVKIQAAHNAMKDIYPQASFSGFKAKSLVSSQPRSDQESRLGAYNRTRHILSQTQADIAVGLEGGVTQTEQGMFTNAWCCLHSRQDLVSYGGGLHFPLPDYIADKINQGGELGPIMDELLHQKNWKQKGGAIEIFSSGILSRTKAYERLVELALTKLVAQDWY